MSRLALPTLWLPDRLRQRREDERLLRGRGGVSQRWMPGYPCCCGEEYPCDFCIDGNTPDEFELTISGVASGSCTDCSGLNGTFIVERTDPENFPCTWYYDFPAGTIDCSGKSPLQIWFGFANLGVDTGWFAMTYLSFSGTEYIHWRDEPFDPETDEFDCMNFVDFAMPYYAHFGVWFPTCNFSGSTAVLNSL